MSASTETKNCLVTTLSCKVGQIGRNRTFMVHLSMWVSCHSSRVNLNHKQQESRVRFMALGMEFGDGNNRISEC